MLRYLCLFASIASCYAVVATYDQLGKLFMSGEVVGLFDPYLQNRQSIREDRFEELKRTVRDMPVVVIGPPVEMREYVSPGNADKAVVFRFKSTVGEVLDTYLKYKEAVPLVVNSAVFDLCQPAGAVTISADDWNWPADYNGMEVPLEMEYDRSRDTDKRLALVKHCGLLLQTLEENNNKRAPIAKSA